MTARTPASWLARIGSVLGSVSGALLLWLVADPLLGVEVAVDFGGQTMDIGPGPVALTSLVASLAGWAVLRCSSVLPCRVEACGPRSRYPGVARTNGDRDDGLRLRRPRGSSCCTWSSPRS